MSLVYTQTAMSPSPVLVPCIPGPPLPELTFPVTYTWFSATLKELLAPAGFLLRLESGKCSGNVCSFSNPVH